MAQASEIKKQYKKRTLFQETWRRLTKNRGAMLGLAFLVLLVLAAALSPVIFDYEKDVIGQNMQDRLMGPCAAHWFGTDEYGRDLFARIIYGARYSLIIGVGSVVLGLLVGTILGSQAGFKGGITDSIIMRGIDIFYSIPNIMTAVVIVSLLGPSTVNLMIALAFSCASSFARIVRASVMTMPFPNHRTDHAADRYYHHLGFFLKLPWNRCSGTGTGVGRAAFRRPQPYP